MKNMLNSTLCVLFIICTTQLSLSQTIFDVTAFGAVNDTKTDNTIAIQSAIDACMEQGGGRVYFPPGTYMTGTIQLKSNVELYLAATATLKGIADMNAYPSLHYGKQSALITAHNQENIAISGAGTLHGNGEHEVFQGADKFNGIWGRPNLLHFRNCTNVRLNTFTARNGARWNLKLQECTHVTVDNIKVISRAVANNDGLDLVDCHYVNVSNSYFDCGDDAICPKSDTRIGCKYITVTNCIIKSESNAIKFGTAGRGGFEDVVISNCTIYDTRLAGIALELVDGGVMDRIAINNITMYRVNGGIFIKLGHRKGEKPGVLRNVLISNIIAEGVGTWKPDTTAAYYKAAHDQRIGMTITGQPEQRIENVTLDNIYMSFAGGGTLADADRLMKESPKTYPEYTNFGITPAYAFNIRHAKNVRFTNVEFKTLTQDDRPALLFENASNITLKGVQATASVDASALIRLKDVDLAFITDNKPNIPRVPFLMIEGTSNDISILNNDLRHTGGAFKIKKSATGTVFALNNLEE